MFLQIKNKSMKM